MNSINEWRRDVTADHYSSTKNSSDENKKYGSSIN